LLVRCFPAGPFGRPAFLGVHGGSEVDLGSLALLVVLFILEFLLTFVPMRYVLFLKPERRFLRLWQWQ